MKETWHSIPGYEGLYEISSIGRIKSLRKIKNIFTAKNGYKYTTLYKNNTGTIGYLHRLMAIVFIPNPNNYPEVNHIDFDKSNNSLKNLEWCSHRYNMKHAWINNRFSLSSWRKLTISQAEDIRKIYKTEKISQDKLAKKYNVTAMTVNSIVNNKGYITQ